ncbi:prolyl oligopeptidase family serine peptidase [Chitinimonas viridis]|uniref:Prolyl oligopeptidase family serine peptidase n=1 Tax=Chitinimonas viridis TaxID=664880 RepID=A0ABT8B6V8_9NEIS|nr:prolyl oligopeptidase family serine peptidase [Chitinimonas viridis]MDN3577740.1 prolyl oligopeptidase family serine peptidase [Chitinimonas viridis]
MQRSTPISLALLCAALLPGSMALADTHYQTPPAELQALVDAPRGPLFNLGPKRSTALLVGMAALPSISAVAQPELRLAGLRINPRMRAASRFDFGNGLSLLDVGTGQQRPVQGLPVDPRIADIAWSSDERWVAFSRWGDNGVELWLLDVAQGQARRLIKEHLNAIAGNGFGWLGGNKQLLVRLAPQDPAAAPVASSVPAGPNTQQTAGGQTSQTRTYADMLKNPADAAQLEWQLQTQIALVGTDGKLSRVGKPATVIGLQGSPDGKYLLLGVLRQPYSYLVPVSRFPRATQVWDTQGKLIKTLAEQPLLERLPSGNDAVQPGPRDFAWRDDAPATVHWTEAQDGGDPNREAKVRDSLFQQAAPFDQPATRLLDVAARVDDIRWGRDDLALVTEGWWKSRDTRTWRIQPGKPTAAAELIVSRKSEDRYSDPGTPLTRLNSYGRPVLQTGKDGNTLLLAGEGASPEGDRPFLDRFHLDSKQTERLWRSEAPYYERTVAVLDDEGQRLVTSREAVDERPNYYLRDLVRRIAPRALTQFPHPYPQFKGMQKELIRYKRADGVDLTATLYLPAGYDPKRDGPRPMLMWAYPQEFKSAKAASQVTDSPYRFNRISLGGPLVMLARGYTVLDDPAMPIIGEGDKEPNDSYLQQLTQSAQAAVDEVVKRGVADRERIAVGGHSYGAFMTANLLAHTRLFRAGIARSGAYNRTLTPFGFQAEDRNFWQAQGVYQTMSPFNHADKIKDALLIIHGEVDNNPGTFPIQSERLYQALQGLGGTARLVMLPHESHGYRARESLMHMLWEQDRWLETYVTQAKPRAAGK